MKNTVYLGFVSVILIMTLLTLVWLGQIKKSNQTVLELIEQFDAKTYYAHLMHDAIQQRQVALLSMVVTEDPFERDDMLQMFYRFAFEYRQARKALHLLPMNKEEKEIHQKLDSLVLRARPINNQAAEMIQAETPYKDIVKVMVVARGFQKEFLTYLVEFTELQKKQDEMAVKYSQKMFDDSVFWVSFFGFVVLVIAVLISHYVSKVVAKKNQLLLQAGEEMAVAYQKAAQATHVKSEFLANMSHEIRTPLTAIIGFAETTLFSEQSMEQRLSAIQTIIRSGKHLLAIINDILDLSKIEANKLEIKYADELILNMLTDIESIERTIAEEKGLSFYFNYIFPLPEEIKTDALRVKQVILNLCNNAIKFTNAGHVLVNISCDASNTFLFEVVDSGIGIPLEKQALIFDAYQQADSTTTRNFGGTGLGLSLSKSLAERMGGSLSVESEEGKGSIFRFYLPCERTENVKVFFDINQFVNLQKKTVKDISHVKLSGKVLLAEDNIDNQELFTILLQRIGIDVTVVGNGQQAVEAVEKDNFDLILMDIRMPVMGGLEATKILRNQGYELPIIAATANALVEERQECFEAGCNDILTKPIDFFQLNEMMTKYLELEVIEELKNITMVSSLLESDQAMLGLITRFVHNFSENLEKIESLISIEDWVELADNLHNVKGTTGSFGFLDVSDLVGKMEFQVANKNKGELVKLFSQVKECNQQMLLGLEKN